MVIINPKNFKVKHSDLFFFDTNIWILIFAPIANYQKRDQKAYSDLLNQLISRNSMICINSIVISEFANVLLRIDYRNWVSVTKPVSSDYKRDFVGSESYKYSVESVKMLIEKILKIPIIEKVSDGFNHISIDGVYKNFGEADFNDAYIAESARINKYIIVTNDADFTKIDADISIVTTRI